MNLFSRLKLNWYDDRETKRLVSGGEYTFTEAPERILDLGAHKGIATEFFARKYPHANIHAYEPNRKLYRKLAARMKKYPNVRVFSEAIAHDGSVEFFVSERNVSSSLFGEGRGFQMPSVSLRTAIERIGFPVAIKMDIEGAEFESLADIPGGVQEIVGELHPEKAGRTNEDARSMLMRGGFHDVVIDGDRKCIFRARKSRSV